MTRRFRSLAPILVILLLGACAGDDKSFYERGLNQGAQNAAKEGDHGEKAAAFPFKIGDLAPAHRPDPKSDEAGIWYQVDKVERRIKTAGERYRHAAVNSYIRSVTCRVTGRYCKDVRVYTIRAPGLQASMYPNGMMHISTGLLLRTQNEAQLAAVIGHETGHYLRRHSLQRIREIIDASNSLFFFRVALAGAGIPVAGDVVTLMAIGEMTAYGRNHEREADGYGLLLMTQAGYDPEEAWKIWDLTLKESKAIKKDEERTVFFASHPQPEERMHEMRRLSKTVKTADTTDLGQDRLQELVAPIRADLIRDELNLRRFDGFEVLLDHLIEGGQNLAELYYFKGEMRRLRGKGKDFVEALGFYDKAATMPGTTPPEFHRSRGVVQRKLGRRNAAMASFAAYLRANPQAADAGIIRQLIEEPEK
ncbi:MAG: M48 family metallopeptidase [Alphaproteobacteria bacterium]|nr:M48 family metallopeptidase [Alphaproteobacteria bacterium]